MGSLYIAKKKNTMICVRRDSLFYFKACFISVNIGLITKYLAKAKETKLKKGCPYRTQGDGGRCGYRHFPPLGQWL